MYIGKGKDKRQETGRYTKEIFLSVVATSSANWENELEQIWRFLTTLEAPVSTNTQEQNRFLEKTKQYFVWNNQLWKRRNQGVPLLVVRDKKCGWKSW